MQKKIGKILLGGPKKNNGGKHARAEQNRLEFGRKMKKKVNEKENENSLGFGQQFPISMQKK